VQLNRMVEQLNNVNASMHHQNNALKMEIEALRENEGNMNRRIGILE